MCESVACLDCEPSWSMKQVFQLSITESVRKLNYLFIYFDDTFAEVCFVRILHLFCTRFLLTFEAMPPRTHTHVHSCGRPARETEETATKIATIS